METASDRKTVKEVAKAGLAFTVLHTLACPCLAGIALKVGIVGTTTLAPLHFAHDYVTEDLVQPVMEYVIEDKVYAHDLAHETVDYAGLGISLGLPAVYLGYALRRRKHKHR